jgi:hypothetical protein
MYSVNMEPHVTGQKGSVYEHLIDVDEHYVAEMQDRGMVLAEDPLRCQALPHMTLARLGPAGTPDGPSRRAIPSISR